MKIGGFKSASKVQEIARNDTTASHIAGILNSPISEESRGDFQTIPMDQVLPDSDQARQLGITAAMLADPSLAKGTPQESVLDSVIVLANSIRDVGQIQPITVYNENGKYRIATGERRWLAHRYLKKDSIKAVVLPSKPSRLRLQQHVENFHRTGLNVKEMLANLNYVIEEAQALGTQIKSFEEFRKLIGMNNEAALKWWSILNGPQDLRDEINAGRFGGLDAATAFLLLETKEQRQEAIVDAQQESGGRLIKHSSALKAVMKKANKDKAAQSAPVVTSPAASKESPKATSGSAAKSEGAPSRASAPVAPVKAGGARTTYKLGQGFTTSKPAAEAIYVALAQVKGEDDDIVGMTPFEIESGIDRMLKELEG